MLLIGLAAFLGFLSYRNLTAAEEQPKQPIAAKPQAEAKRPAVALTISAETTYITRPLRQDGYVNYVAAINERMREGVTLENNAAVLFLKAMGPGEIDPRNRGEYFRLLGIGPLPEQGDYFITFDKYTQPKKGVENASEAGENGHDIYAEQLTPAMKRPWSKKEFPLLANWLAANEKPLSLLVESSKRPRRFDPLVPENGSVIGALLPAIGQYKEAARALAALAMLRAGEGKIDEAWEKLLACHRLARLAGQGPTLIDALVANPVDYLACGGDQGILQTRLSPAQVAAMRADLDKLPPLPKMVDKLKLAERFLFLDYVGTAARDGFSSLSLLSGDTKPKGMLESMVDSAARSGVDWDRVLRIGNSWYDRMTDAFNSPTRADREKALGKIDGDIRRLVAETRDWKKLGLAFFGGPRAAVSERIGQMLVALLLPAVRSCATAEDRATMQFELDRLAFALAAYRADHGSYPARLADLVPQYVTTVPNDIFNASELHYRPKGGGFLLYSVGANGKDDGGKGYDDSKQGEGWDDLSVRVSAEKR
jgi:hypothetical protein